MGFCDDMYHPVTIFYPVDIGKQEFLKILTGYYDGVTLDFFSGIAKITRIDHRICRCEQHK